MRQGELFSSDGTPRPAASAPKAARTPSSPAETRRAAGVRIWPKLNQLHRAVLEFVESRGQQGATDEEIQRLLFNCPRSARGWLQELADTWQHGQE